MSQIKEEFKTIMERKNCGEEGSYTNYLFNKGTEKITKKIGEEATEVVIAAIKDDKKELVGEICDLAYHVLVLMAEKGVSLEDIEEDGQISGRKRFFFGFFQKITCLKVCGVLN